MVPPQDLPIHESTSVYIKKYICLAQKMLTKFQGVPCSV